MSSIIQVSVSGVIVGLWISLLWMFVVDKCEVMSIDSVTNPKGSVGLLVGVVGTGVLVSIDGVVLSVLDTALMVVCRW